MGHPAEESRSFRQPGRLRLPYSRPVAGAGTADQGGRPSAFRGVGWGSRGFTALELIIVVVFVVVLAAVGFPTLLGTIQRYRTRAGADQVTGELRRIQSLAMTTGSRHRLFIRACPGVTVACKEYRREREAAGPAWPASSDSTSSNANVLTEWVDIERAYGGVLLTSLKDAGGTDRTEIIFDSRGASVNAGVTYPLTITVAHTSGAQRTIQIKSAGGVKMQ